MALFHVDGSCHIKVFYFGSWIQQHSAILCLYNPGTSV